MKSKQGTVPFSHYPHLHTCCCKKPAPGCALCEDCVRNLTRYDDEDADFCELFAMTPKRRKTCNFYVPYNPNKKER